MLPRLDAVPLLSQRSHESVRASTGRSGMWQPVAHAG
jgi:hypothetical protein